MIKKKLSFLKTLYEAVGWKYQRHIPIILACALGSVSVK